MEFTFVRNVRFAEIEFWQLTTQVKWTAGQETISNAAHMNNIIEFQYLLEIIDLKIDTLDKT